MTSPSTETVAFRSALQVIWSSSRGSLNAIGAEVAVERRPLRLIASEENASQALPLAMGNGSATDAEGTIGRWFERGPRPGRRGRCRRRACP